MNERSDLDRVLRHWFDDGPSTMPDRVVDIVADRIARQRQRPAWRLLWRPFDMNPYLKIGAAVAAVLVLAIVGWNLLPVRQDTGVGGPAASPSPSASSSSATPTTRPSASARAWWLSSTDGPCGEAPRPDGCAGELAAGVQTSGGFTRTITYTVPEGWVNYRDWADYFAMFPDTPKNRAIVAGAQDPSTDILVITFGDAFKGCAESPQSGAAGIVAGFAALEPSPAVTRPVTIGTLSGHQTDLSYFPEAPLPCPGAPVQPASPTGGRYRAIVLDVPGGDPLGIFVRASSAADFDSIVAAAMPVIQSFRLESGATPSPS